MYARRRTCFLLFNWLKNIISGDIMKYGKLTNVAILILIAAAVFQTGKLWLENTESRNFFSFYSSVGKEIKDTDKNYDIIGPEKIVVGYGNKKFDMLYSGEKGNSIVSLCEKVINDVFLSGSFIKTESINWEAYIEGKAVIMKYPFYVSSGEYMKGYGISNSAFSESVKSINYIVVAPGSGSSESTYCYFIDGSTSEAYIFMLNGSESPSALYNAIQNMQYSDDDSMEYISTVQSGMNIFDSIYVPQWTEGEYKYNPIKVSSPFMSETGEFDRNKLSECVNNFFDNYVSGEDASNVNNIYTFSNDNVVVKYYDNGVLEYYNYDIGAADEEQSLSSAYTISESFIERDKMIIPDLYLSGVETRNDGLVFYYDYAVNNIPVKFSDETEEKLGMNHAVEVVVSNGNVKRYKRYIADFKADESTVCTINVDMISAWDNAIMNYAGSEDVTSISDMFIGYYLDTQDKMNIKWFTMVNGSTIVGETYK